MAAAFRMVSEATPALHGNAGVYLLVLNFPRPLTLRIGALGRRGLAPGWYVYAGSARRNLRQRVARHMARAKRRRWHIDSLTTAAGVKRLGALLVAERAFAECALNLAAGQLIGGETAVAGFGASDCRAGCPAHLWYTPEQVTPAGIARGLELEKGQWEIVEPG